MKKVLTWLSDWLRKTITYKFLVISSIVCILILTFFIWPTIIGWINPKKSSSLDISKETIPILLLETDQNNLQHQKLYLCFWNYFSGKISRDDVPVCDLIGEVYKIIWSGNNQIFLIPRNDRSTIIVRDHNPYFQIEVKLLNNPMQDFVKSSNSGNKMYKLVLNPSTKKINLIISNSNKSQTIEVNDTLKDTEIEMIRPFFLFSDENNPIVYCLFEKKNQTKKGWGVIKGVLTNRSFEWTIVKGIDEKIPIDSITTTYIYRDKFIFASQNSVLLQYFKQNTSNIYPLTNANNYLEMFRHYLFGWKGIEGIIARQGYNLIEQTTEPSSLGKFNDNLLISWSPNFTSNNTFYAKQILAIQGEKVLGRIEIIGEKIMIYSDSLIVNDEVGDYLYLSSKWFLPNE